MIKNINNSEIKLPKAVLFDTDNTLYEYSTANSSAEEAVFSKAKNLLGINSKQFSKMYKIAKAEIKSAIPSTASSHSRLLYFQRTIELLGHNAQLLLALDFEQTFWRTFLANAYLFNGVKETLLFFKEKKIPIGVVTDLTAQIQLRKLTYFGLENMFNAVVTSEEVGIDKPDERNFTLALKKLDLSSKDHFWMIGDNPKADIYGANQLGATTFQKVHNFVKIGDCECKPDYIIHEYPNFLKSVRNLFKERNY